MVYMNIKGLSLTVIMLFFGLQSMAQVVAVVGNKKITLDEFKSQYKKTEGLTGRPGPEVFLEELVRYEMGVQEAKKKKLDNHPIVKERAKQEMYKLLIEQSIADQVAKIKVTERDMLNQYRRTPEIRTSHILISVKPDATKEQRAEAYKRAQQIYKEVLKEVKKGDKGRSFAELVKLYSDDTLSKVTGGDVGYLSSVALSPAYYNVAKDMKVGQVKGLISTQNGYHIIKKTGVRSYANADKTQLRAVVFEQKRKVIFDNFFSKLQKKYDIKLNKKAVKNIN